MKRIVIIIQARLTSKRLPSKVLFTLGSNTVIERIYNTCTSVAPTVVAIPDTLLNDGLASFLHERHIPYYRGNEDDVLCRYANCASSIRPLPEVIVRITADCPFISEEMIRRAISAHLSGPEGLNYTSNVVYRTFAKGLDVEVFDYELLRRAAKEATLPYDREHVGPYIRKIADHHVHFSQESDESNINLCLDTDEDYKRLVQHVEGRKDS